MFRDHFTFMKSSLAADSQIVDGSLGLNIAGLNMGGDGGIGNMGVIGVLNMPIGG